jgi:hypothetical protein
MDWMAKNWWQTLIVFACGFTLGFWMLAGCETLTFVEEKFGKNLTVEYKGKTYLLTPVQDLKIN